MFTLSFRDAGAAREPGTQAMKALEKLVFMDSEPGRSLSSGRAEC